ncbi:hypothetical protein DFJ63DRAFT_335582 [Scheffersomyces coipomensis]|uniref:uncharacterized protein n=1 Tax=Scheffersomyces coipomensis TaxID=1788519 RepID=UPI00315D4898
MSSPSRLTTSLLRSSVSGLRNHIHHHSSHILSPSFIIPTRFNSNLSTTNNKLKPITAKPNIKKKNTIQKNLRRTDPTFLNESTNYILSLLNDNNPNDNPSANLEKYLSIVTSVTLGESIDLDKLFSAFIGYDNVSVIIPDEVINIKINNKDLMILSNGTVVGWNLTESEILQFHRNDKYFHHYIKDTYPEFESEEMDWIELDSIPPQFPLNNGNSYLQGEIMVVQGQTPSKRILDKAAFAIGLSRSTRLSILENQFENHLLITKKNAEFLSKGNKIIMTESDFLKLTGELFLIRGKLNLYSELIETPDLYWSEPSLEKIYNSVSKILDIQSRISILNRKLDYATEEQRAFLGVLNEKKSTRLEWIIIILIMVEVGFESFHFYEKYSTSNDHLKQPQ